MGLFGKIKEILFDEETVEIPVITKDDKIEEKSEKKTTKETNNKPKKNDDDVIIKKIETPKRSSTNKTDDLLFDMPKFKEEVKEEKKANSFSFPVFDDEDLKESKRERRSNKNINAGTSIEETPKRAQTNEKKNSGGYTTAFDYSYGKYKGDYKSNRESNQAILTKTLNEKEEHNNFTPSPIISPVFGVLNENYKKEDIVNKTETHRSEIGILDLDSVRRKAYGTLEDDLESSMDRKDDFIEEPEVEEDLYDDDGISINDLLVDSQNDDETLNEINDQTSEIELFNVLDTDIDEEKEVLDSPQEEIELSEETELNNEIEMPQMSTPNLEDDEVKEVPEKKKKNSTRTGRLSDEKVVEEIKEENRDEKESLGEEDLFDLIDSLYDGKDEA